MRPETSPCNSDLVIVLLRPEPEQRWGYYFADNARHTIFWLDHICLSTVVASCSRFVPTDEHLSPSSFTATLLYRLADCICGRSFHGSTVLVRISELGGEQ